MRMVVCEDCKKRYDYEQNNFCPRCGAFHSPGKRQAADNCGKVTRLDSIHGINGGRSIVKQEKKYTSLVRDRVMDFLDKALSLCIVLAVAYVLLWRGVVLFAEMYGGL